MTSEPYSPRLRIIEKVGDNIQIAAAFLFVLDCLQNADPNELLCEISAQRGEERQNLFTTYLFKHDGKKLINKLVIRIINNDASWDFAPEIKMLLCKYGDDLYGYLKPEIDDMDG